MVAKFTTCQKLTLKGKIVAWIPIGKEVMSSGTGVDASAVVFVVVCVLFANMVAQEKVLLDSTVDQSRGSGTRQYKGIR